jgi:hypothetical protein
MSQWCASPTPATASRSSTPRAQIHIDSHADIFPPDRDLKDSDPPPLKDVREQSARVRAPGSLIRPLPPQEEFFALEPTFWPRTSKDFDALVRSCEIGLSRRQPPWRD